MSKFFTGKSNQKNTAILVVSILIVAAVGLVVALSFSSTSLVSPFLTASVGGSGQSVGTAVRITQSPAIIDFGYTITLKGTGFTPEHNRVHIGTKQVNDIQSFQNGTVLVFEIPARKDIPTASYQMFVRNSRGTSNSVTVQVVNPTFTPTPTAPPLPYLMFSCVPNSQTVEVGQSVTVSEDSFEGLFSATWTAPDAKVKSGTGTSFTTSYTTPGDKVITATSVNYPGATKTATCAVHVITKPPVMSSLSPSTASSNTTVTITGSGFTANANQIYFAQQNVAVNNIRSTANGTKMTFKVSDFIDCSRPGRLCIPASTTGPVQYPIYVKNANGQSNQMVLTVTR